MKPQAVYRRTRRDWRGLAHVCAWIVLVDVLAAAAGWIVYIIATVPAGWWIPGGLP